MSDLGLRTSEEDIPGSRSRDIGYGFVDLERPGFEQSNNGLRLGASGIGVRAKHRRSGDRVCGYAIKNTGLTVEVIRQHLHVCVIELP